MQFTLAGQSFDVTAEVVRERLRREVREPVREHWVDVDGVRWPVKQVLALATGLPRAAFQSLQSRAILSRLGFEVDADDGVRARLRAQGPRGASVDSDARQTVDSVDLRLRFDWLDTGFVRLDDASLPVFPPLPDGPGLYRFDFGVDAAGVRTLYIGESARLSRRGRSYRHATSDSSTQKTNRRLHKRVVEHVRAGGTIAFAVAVEVRVGDGDSIDLRRRSARRLAENAAVLLAQLSGVIVLNWDVELSEVDADS